MLFFLAQPTSTESIKIRDLMTSSTAKHRVRGAGIIPVIVTVLCLVPFVGKAFHIDDPVFIWSAKQIQVKPADFYGFTVNWDGTEKSMAEVMHNPPVACYYVALAGSLFGYSEVALHTAFLAPAVAAALGIFCLARRFCSQPQTQAGPSSNRAGCLGACQTEPSSSRADKH